MAIDWQASEEKWMAAVQTRLTPRLLKDARLISSKDCTARFETSVSLYRALCRFGLPSDALGQTKGP